MNEPIDSSESEASDEANRLRAELTALRAQLGSVAKANARAAIEMASIHEARQQELIEQREALRRALEDAERASRKKDEFLAKVSHELRTPLNGVIGMTTLLRDGLEGSVERQQAQSALDAAGNLFAIVEDILDLSKIETDGIQLTADPYDLWELLDGVAEALAPRFDPDRVQFSLIAERDLPRRVRGDAARVRQILFNLCSNALKFTEAGEVRIRAGQSEDGQFIRITVEDTGPGIPHRALEGIFEAFRQFDDSASRSHGGVGLGLPISRELAERMGGALTAKSEVGRGSHFEVLLPIGDIESSTDDPSAEVSGAYAIASEPAHVLALEERAAALGVRLGILADAEGARAAGWPSTLGPQDVVLVELPRDGHGARLTLIDELEAAGVTVTWLCSGATAKMLQVEGREPGRWTPFRIRGLAAALRGQELPDVRAVAAPEGEEPCEEGQAADDRLRVLIVEDNPVNQRVAARTVERLGHAVEVVDSGAGALEILGRSRFDLVLMDCQMPRMDGYEATRLIRWGGHVLDPRVPVVALTANAMPGDREKCMAAGMDGHIAKPFAARDLDALLRSVSRARSRDAA